MGKLTAVKVRSLKEPGRNVDGDGLFLELNGKASGRWLLRIQSNGKRRDIGLGSLKAVSLADAREAASVIRKKVAQGIDPVAERKQERLVVPTFRIAATSVHDEHKAGWKNGKHQNQWLSTLTTYAFPKIGDLPVDKIEGPQIRDLLAPIWLSKPDRVRMAVQLDDGRSVAFDVKDYNQIDHGYAATIHKAQGMTVDRTYVLATPGMDSHATYVALSRHRDGVELHYGNDDFADRGRLARTLSRERGKDMASDYADRETHGRGFAERRGITFRERILKAIEKVVPEKVRGMLVD